MMMLPLVDVGVLIVELGAVVPWNLRFFNGTESREKEKEERDRNREIECDVSCASVREM